MPGAAHALHQLHCLYLSSYSEQCQSTLETLHHGCQSQPGATARTAIIRYRWLAAPTFPWMLSIGADCGRVSCLETSRQEGDYRIKQALQVLAVPIQAFSGIAVWTWLCYTLPHTIRHTHSTRCTQLHTPNCVQSITRIQLQAGSYANSSTYTDICAVNHMQTVTYRRLHKLKHTH